MAIYLKKNFSFTFLKFSQLDFIILSSFSLKYPFFISKSNKSNLINCFAVGGADNLVSIK